MKSLGLFVKGCHMLLGFKVYFEVAVHFYIIFLLFFFGQVNKNLSIIVVNLLFNDMH